MNLKRSDWDFHISIDPNLLNVFVVPDVNLLFRYERELISQNKGEIGEFTVMESDREINLELEVELIPQPYTLSLNSRKTISHLHKSLVKEVTALGYSSRTDVIHQELVKLLKEIRTLTLTNFVFEDDIGLDDFVKLYGVQYSDCFDNPADLLIKYLDIVMESSKLKIIIFFHGFDYFTLPQIDELSKYLKRHELIAIFFERHRPTEENYISNVKIIDSDICYNQNEE